MDLSAIARQAERLGISGFATVGEEISSIKGMRFPELYTTTIKSIRECTKARIKSCIKARIKACIKEARSLRSSYTSRSTTNKVIRKFE